MIPSGGWQLLGGLLVVATVSRPLGAQRPAFVVDAGLTVAAFADDNVAAFGPSIRLTVAGTRGRFFGAAEGGALATFGATSGYASVVGGARAPLGGRWSTDLTGELGSVAGSNTNGGAGTALLSGRALWQASAGGAWLRATGHGSERTHTTLSGGGVDAGAWWGTPRLQVAAAVAHEWTRAELFTGPLRTGYAGTTRVRYGEGTLTMHTEGDLVTLDLSASSRRDPDASHLFEQGLGVTGAFWMRESMAVVLQYSRQLPDWVRGSDAADIVSVGLRFGQASPATARSARFIPIVQVSDADGSRTLRVHVAGARQVDVMGDFTDWEVQPLSRNGTVFERTVTLASGTHRLLVRIDGGAWRPAANTPAVDDDLGGRVGLLVIP